MKEKTLSPELIHKMDAYWRAANYLAGGQNLFVEEHEPEVMHKAMAATLDTAVEHIKQRRYRPGELFV